MANTSAETAKFREMFDFHSAPTLIGPDDEEVGVLAFGRKDRLVAQKIADVVRLGLAGFVVITGGVGGKDSGDLVIPEAEYLARQYEEIRDSYSRDSEQNTGNLFFGLVPVFIETQATNGGENVRNSLTVMQRGMLNYRAGLACVAHATSSRRLTAMVAHETAHNPIDRLYSYPTDYAFDPSNPPDQKEAAAELVRFADWPAKGWLGPAPTDFPSHLVEFAREHLAQAA